MRSSIQVQLHQNVPNPHRQISSQTKTRRDQLMRMHAQIFSQQSTMTSFTVQYLQLYKLYK